MILIENKLVSEEIFNTHFKCDVLQCKGKCCVEGEAGAPLEEAEKKEIENAFEIIKPNISADAMQEIEKKGLYTFHHIHGDVTPTINDEGLCVYAKQNDNGVISCLFEEAYLQNKISFRKPISCHLYPIRILKTPEYDCVNYEAIDICKSGCVCGKKNKLPLFQFLKNALIKKYGEDFFAELEQVYQDYNKSFLAS